MRCFTIVATACFTSAVFGAADRCGHTGTAPAEIVKTAREYLAAPPDQRADLEQTLRSYKGSIEPVIRRLKPSAWKSSATGILAFQTFTIAMLKAEYPDLVFHVYVPPDYDPRQPMGLFIFMHGGGVDNQAPWPLVYLKRRLRPEVDHASFITVTPLAPLVKSYNRWNVPQADEYIAAIITECSERFHIDPDRVFLGGSSMGGIGAYHLCQRLCDRIAAGFAAAGRWNASDWRSLTGTPLFILHGVNDSYWQSPKKYRDRMTDVSYARYAVQLLDRAGVEHVYHESPGGHVWSSDEGRKGLARFVEWAQTKRRNPFEKRIVAMTPKSIYVGPKSKDYADLTPQPSPHNRWLTILAIGRGKIRLDAHTVLQSSRYDSREAFAAYRSELSTRDVHGGLVTGTLLDDNRIELQTENVRRVALWLHPDMVDFSKPVKVDIDGHKQSVTCHPSLLDALRSYERRRDWGLIYHCEIPLDVP